MAQQPSNPNEEDGRADAEQPLPLRPRRRMFVETPAETPPPPPAETGVAKPDVPGLKPSRQQSAPRGRWAVPLSTEGRTLSGAEDAPGPTRKERNTPAPQTLQSGEPGPESSTDGVKERLHELLIEELDHFAMDDMSPAVQRETVIRAARELLQQEGMRVPGTSRDELLESVADEVLGLGPLEPLLRDPAVSEVMVNGIDKIYYETDGRIFRAPIRFKDKGHVMRIVERIVAPLGRRIDESSPMVDARLPDGSRVNITIPPASPSAPTITIRKFRADKMRMADLIAVGALTEQTADFLAMCVRAHLNIIISGGTGTGKTTMLNALSAFIPNNERIITIEDPSELRLQQEHVITLEARPPSIEGKNAILQRDLVRNTLRMRPDRIIVGEVRGTEAFDMLQAMNTGHDGSISTVHANTPRDAVSRLENMVLMASMELPARAIREQVASAIHVFLQVSRLQDGSRKITHVTEVSGMEGETITLQDIFLFKLDEVDANGKVHGRLKPTGVRPRFAEKFALAGIEMPASLFGTVREEAS